MNIPVIALTLLDNYTLVRSLACTAAGRKKKGDYCLRQVMADLEVSCQTSSESFGGLAGHAHLITATVRYL